MGGRLRILIFVVMMPDEGGSCSWSVGVQENPQPPRHTLTAATFVERRRRRLLTTALLAEEAAARLLRSSSGTTRRGALCGIARRAVKRAGSRQRTAAAAAAASVAKVPTTAGSVPGCGGAYCAAARQTQQ